MAFLPRLKPIAALLVRPHYICAAFAIALLGQASPKAAQDAQREFNCTDPTLWNDPQGMGMNYDYANCGTMWALKSANDANVLNERYMLTLEKKIVDAKKSGDTAILDQFKRQGFCNQNYSMDQCHDYIRRRVMSHTLRVRDNILETNRLMTELDDGQVEKIAGANPAQKSIIESIDEDRKAITPPGKSRSCEENPFIPCIVQYGKSGSVAAKGYQRIDTASESLIKGNYEINAVKRGTLREGTGETSLEISDQNRENEGLRKLVDTRLRDGSAGNIYERSDYAQDMHDEKARIDAKEVEEKSKGSYLRDTGDVNWDAFNAVMDELARRRAESRSSGSLVSFYLPVEEGPRGANDKRSSTLDSQILDRLTETPAP